MHSADKRNNTPVAHLKAKMFGLRAKRGSPSLNPS
jgi:hypothetical protein